MSRTIIAPAGGGAAGGSGDVVGPAASVDGEVALYSGVTGKLLGGSSALRATTDGRITQLVTPVYDLAASVLAVSFDADLGAQAVPNGKQINQVWLRGSLTSSDDTTDHYLNGLVFNYTNNATANALATDHNRVRPIIGQATTTGPGSIRCIHVNAIATGASTGSICGVLSNLTAVATSAIATAFLASTTGAADVSDVLGIAGGGARWRYGLEFHLGDFLGAAILLQNSSTFGGGSRAGRILGHTDGASLEWVGGNVIQMTVADFKLGASGAGRYMEFWEMTAPAAPATNSVRLYAEDDGTGKTQLTARFPTGAPVVLANEAGGGGGGAIDGAGAATQLAFWSDADTLTGSSGLTYDGTTLSVTLPNISTIPLVRLESTHTNQTATRAALILARTTPAAQMLDGFGVRQDFVLRDVDGVDNYNARISVTRAGADNTGAFALQTAIAGTLADRLTVSATGAVAIPDLGGSGTRVVQADTAGLLSGVSVPRVYARDPAGFVYNTDATERTVWSFTLAAGDLGTIGLLRVLLAGTILANSGAPSTFFKVKLGATTLWGDTGNTLAASAIRKPWWLEFVLAAQSSTSVQVLNGRLAIGAGTVSGAGAAGVGIVDTASNALASIAEFAGSSTENSTGTLTVAVTNQFSVSNVAVELVRQVAYATLN